MYKFAHMADIHLGFEQYRLPFRAEEFKNSFERAIKKAVEERVDFILISGDLFHKSNPSPQTIKEAIEILKIPKDEGIPVFTIEGNHDRTIKKVSVHHLLESLGLINVLGFTEEKKEGEFIETERVGDKLIAVGVYKDLKIFGLRYMSSLWFSKNKDKLRVYFKPDGESILMLHQGIKEYSDQNYELSLSHLPNGFLYYALGHIHKKWISNKDIGKVVYPGSLERWDFGDYEVRYIIKNNKMNKFNGYDKGFYIVEDFEPRFIKLNVRPFYDINIEWSKDVKELLKTLKIPKEAFLRLYIKTKGKIDVNSIKELFDVSYIYTKVESYNNIDNGNDRVKEEKYFNEFERELINYMYEGINEKEILNLILKHLGYDKIKGQEEKNSEIKKYKEIKLDNFIR
ncbi:metallophosphoesterase [Methanocaldococcus sp.]